MNSFKSIKLFLTIKSRQKLPLVIKPLLHLHCYKHIVKLIDKIEELLNKVRSINEVRKATLKEQVFLIPLHVIKYLKMINIY